MKTITKFTWGFFLLFLALLFSPQAPIANWFKDDDMHHHGALSLQMMFNFFSVFGVKRDSLTTHWPHSKFGSQENIPQKLLWVFWSRYLKFLSPYKA